jgi:hypothetical protein
MAAASSSSNGPITSTGRCPAAKTVRQGRSSVGFSACAGDGLQPPLGQAIDHASDAGPIGRAGAHAAGLSRSVERAGRQELRIELFRGRCGKKSLGMAGHVVVRHIAVLGLACTTDQDRAEGVIAVSAGALRHLKGAAQEFFVIKRRHGGVHFPDN